MGDIIKLRRDTAANWASYNPILSLGEPGVETDTKRWKIGDGVTAWNSLPYRNEYSIFNVSWWNRASNQLSDYARYSSLADAINAIPAEFRQVGMSIKYIDTTTENYLQYRYTAVDIGYSYFSNTDNWQSQNIDAEPTLGSKNLVKSGDVANNSSFIIKSVNAKYINANGEINDTNNTFSLTDYYIAYPGIIMKSLHGAGTSRIVLAFYDKDFQFISSLGGSDAYQDVTLDENNIPENAVYFRANTDTVSPPHLTRFYRVIVGVDANFDENSPNPLPNSVISRKFSEIDSRLPFKISSTSSSFLDSSGNIQSTSVVSYSVTNYYPVYPGLQIKHAHAPGANYGSVLVAFYDKDFQFISTINHTTHGYVDITLDSSNIPQNAVYFRANINDANDKDLTKFYILKVYGLDPNLNINSNNLLPNRVITEITTYPINNVNKTYLGKDGKRITTTVTTFSVSNYCLALEGVKVHRIHTSSNSKSDYTAIAFYDKDFNFVDRIRNTDTSAYNYTLQAADIPTTAKYFRACLYDDGYVDYRTPLNINNPIINVNENANLVPFDYEKALAMPRQQLQAIVEMASNGRCTVLYDDDNYPSLMYKIPKIGIGSLVADDLLGDKTVVHPAFIVNGVEKNLIYMSVFQTSLYDGHYVSWYGLPSKGALNLSELRAGISNKGNGWHLETLYERSLLSLLTMCLNSSQPTGNTNKGRSHLHHWEYCQMYDGVLPGAASGLPTGNKWINGTQPSAWAHNKELWGIQDVIGGYHEICDLFKIVNGQIYIASDNNYFKKGDDESTFENSWIATGVYYNVVDNNIVLDTEITTYTTDPYKEKSYPDIRCTANYDEVALSTRKLLCLLLVAPVLDSSNTSTIFDFIGRFGIANHKSVCYGVFGGAEEYSNSGLGCQITGYDLSGSFVAHGNMGSRLVFIE